jgi:hypothetical protein
MQKLYYYFFLLLWFSACTSYPEAIEEVLRQAGSNRAELEKVLKHYGKNPADSLKFRAAEFLIINMPGKHSAYYDAPWNDVAAVGLRWTSSLDKQRVLDAYQLGNPVIQEDLKYITSDYLINNIDLAFKVWRERPWGKHIPFGIFCEEILPYRIGTEPLENWRKKALASFAGLDTILDKPNTTAIEACKAVNEVLPKFRLDKDFPDMTFSQSMASTRGSCDRIVAFTAFAMRGLGIPVTVDFTRVYTGRDVGHSWNTVCDSTGKHISFLGTETQPGATHQAIEVVQNKIYRKTYAVQKENMRIPPEDIPPLLRGNCADASSEYEGFFDIRVPLTASPQDSSGQVYLAVAGLQSTRNIIARGRIEGEYGVFSAVGRATGYFPVYYKDNRPVAAGVPFLLDGAGDMHPVVNGPFKGPHVLSAGKPCIIPMSDFDIGGEGTAFHETSEMNKGGTDWYRLSGNDPFSIPVDIEAPEMSLSYIEPGEWVQYTVEVNDAGIYRCQLHASGMDDGKFHLEVDGENRTGSVNLPANGEWYRWKWQPGTPLRLTFAAGTHQIRFYCEQTGYNLKAMKLTFLKK